MRKRWGRIRSVKLDTEMKSIDQQKMHIPKVSIGMPVYNGEKFIREALDSLLAQTFTDFELIISDNASTDGTEAICREYAEKDARIRYVRQIENKGATANFQFVLDEAAGEYFMWAATDDFWDKNFIKKTLSEVKKTNAVGVISKVKFSNHCLSNATESIDGDALSRLKKFINNPGDNSRFYSLFVKNKLREAIKDIKFDFFAGDWLITSAILSKGAILEVPEILMTRTVAGQGKYFSSLPRNTIFPLFRFSLNFLKKHKGIDTEIIVRLIRLNIVQNKRYVKYVIRKHSVVK